MDDYTLAEKQFGFPIPSGVRAVPLGVGGASGMFTLVDERDYALVSQFVWTKVSVGVHQKFFYAMRKRGLGKGKGAVTEYLHRLIANPADGLVVDHVNHNGLDNRRENLRVVTQGENVRASRKKTWGEQDRSRFLPVTVSSYIEEGRPMYKSTANISGKVVTRKRSRQKSKVIAWKYEANIIKRYVLSKFLENA